MSRYARESSDESDWVHLTPPGEDESSVDQQSFGGTQDPRPPTNPRPRPPRSTLDCVDDSRPPTTSLSTARSYYSGDSLTAGGALSSLDFATQLSPETRRSSPDHRLELIIPQYRHADQGGQYASSSPLSVTSSTAMTAEMRTTNYDTMASSLFSIRPNRRASGSSARTDSISNRYILDEDEGGNLHTLDNIAPARGTLQCPLASLGCREWFDDPLRWESHCRAHFRGQLPRSINCPFRGCGESFREQSSQQAWVRRWNHILTCPFRTSGVSTILSRSLVDHLWRVGIISNDQEQVFRQTGSFGESGRYLESSSSSRDRERGAEDYRSPGNQDHGGGGSSYC